MVAVNKPQYVWSEIIDILPDPVERKFLFDVCKHEGMDTLFVQINWAMNLDWTDFMAEANSRGIAIHALISGNSAFDDYSQLVDFAETNGFTGITWDIEPVDVVAFGNLIDFFASPLYQSVYVDAPFYLNKNRGASYEDIRAFYRKFDLILLNSYADTLSFAIIHANDGPEICAEEGVDYMLGLDTGENPTEGGIYTTYEEGLDYYRQLLADIKSNYQGAPHFKGVYTHYWRSFREWFNPEDFPEISPIAKIGLGGIVVAAVIGGIIIAVTRRKRK